MSRRDGMPVLTLHQPFATLVAIGVKGIETRDRLTHIRGRIAIHAAAKKFGVNSPTAEAIRSFPRSTYNRLRDRTRCDIETSDGWTLGAIVATANLADCLQMIGSNDDPTGRHLAPVYLSGESRWYLSDREILYVEDVTHQVPYGHFAPGRWAWLLEDVEPLDVPVPFKGGQGWSKTWDGQIKQFPKQAQR